MKVHVTPETAKKLAELAAYIEAAASLRKTLDSRCDELSSGRVQPIDSEDAFRRMREKSQRRRTGG